MNLLGFLLILCGLTFTPLFIIFACKNATLKKTTAKYRHELDRLLSMGAISREQYQNCMRYINDPNVTGYYNSPTFNPNMLTPYPPQPPMNPNQPQGYRPPVNYQPTPQPIQQQNNLVMPNPNMQQQYQQAPPRPVQVPPQPQMFTPQPVYRPVQPVNPVVKTSNESMKTSIILIIGVALVVLAGIIFSTTTWDTLSSVSKTIIVFSVSALFFGVSVIAEKIIHLNKTSMAFYMLGSIFLPLTIICAGYFELFGDYLSLSGGGSSALLTIAFVALGVPSYIGSFKYSRVTVFAWGFLICITSSFLCLLNQFNLPGDIFAICMAVYSTVFILVVDFSEITKGDSSYSKILKLFSIINTGVLCFASVFLTSDGIIALIPLGIFSFVFLSSLFIYSEYSIGAYPYAIIMLIGLYKFKKPDKASDLLFPLVALALLSTVLSIANIVREPVKKILKYISLATVPFAFVFFMFFTIFSGKWSVISLTYIAILIANVSWLAFFNKIRLALYGHAVLVFIFLNGLSSYLLPQSAYRLALCTSLAFFAFVTYRFIPKIRTLASDLIFGLTGLICWYILIFQATDPQIKTASLICVTIFAIAALILASDNNRVLSIIFCWVISVAPVLIAFSAYERIKIDISAITSFSLTFFPCTLLMGALAVLSALFKNESTLLKRLSLPSFISSISFISIFFIRELTIDTHRMPYAWIAVIILAFKAYQFMKNDDKKAFDIDIICLFSTVSLAILISILNYEISVINAFVIVAILPLIIFTAYLITNKFYNKDYVSLSIFSSYSTALLGFIIMMLNYDDNAVGYNLYVIALVAVCYYAFSFVRMNLTGFLPLLYLPFAIKLLCIGFTDNDGIILSVMMLCFVAFLVLGRARQKSLITKLEGTYSIDWLTITSFLFAVLIPYNENTLFFLFVFIAIYIMGYFRRGFTANTDKLLVLSSSIFLSFAFWTQQFFEIPDIIQAEVFLIPVAALCAVIILLWKGYEKITWNIAFYTALVSVLYLGLSAIASEELTDALIILCTMMLVIIISFKQKSMRWFLLSACTLIFLSFYLTREFWLDIQWWVYLLTAGIILLCMAALHERRKQQGITKWEFKLLNYFKK